MNSQTNTTSLTATALRGRENSLKDDTVQKITNPDRYTELIEKQPTLNVGTIGHVMHGKSTLVEALSSVKTGKFDDEMMRNMTIRLGYANAKIWKCPNCPEPRCYSCSSSKVSSSNAKCHHCENQLTLVRHVSFVDCPGHDVLMATMLNGAAVMDAALLIVAANEACPQPQTKEHLAAVEVMGLKNFAIIQNKVDLVDEKRAVANFNSIQSFATNTAAAGAPVIPVSAQRRLNVDAVCHYLGNLALPTRDLNSPPLLIIIRSFDVNKPGLDDLDKLHGGIAGGSLTRGVLEVGQLVEVRPGVVYSSQGQTKCRPIRTRVTSLSSEQNKLDFAIPGGLIGVGTNLDPSLTKADGLVGHVIGIPGHLPPVFQILVVSYAIMKRVVGVDGADDVRKPDAGQKPSSRSNKPLRVPKLQTGEELKVNVGSCTTNATVMGLREDVAKLRLQKPCCAELKQKVSLSRRINDHWRLVGFGIIQEGSVELALEQS